VDSFVQLDPTLTITTGMVPYWSKFPVEPSAAALAQYLDTTPPYEEILLTLFSHGTDGVGVAPIERWRALLDRATRGGRLLGVDPGAYPRDFASFGRFHRQLSRLPRSPAPAPLTVDELDAFLAEHPDLPAGVSILDA
jgi:hypothetical protein